MKPRSTHRLASLAIGALAAAVLAGCGAVVDTDTDSADAEVASRTPRPAKTATSAATSDAPDQAPSSPAEDALEEQPSASATAGVTLPSLLLSAGEVPGLDSGFTWTEGRTTKREPQALAGTCHRFSMLSIGAMRVVHRDYTSADSSAGAHANELVATFADTKTAWRAFQVLKSWRDDCAETLDKWERHDVGDLQKVDVGAAEAHTYLLTYGPADDQSGDSSYYDAQGLTMVGSRIAVLRIAYVGQDYDYPSGKEPITAAVSAAAEKLS